MKRRGVSPVIATILLIMIVIVLALVVFLWLKGLTGEAITKFEQNAELICLNQISFQAQQTGDTLTIRNTGTTPIYRIRIKEESRNYQITDLESNWPKSGLGQGQSVSVQHTPTSGIEKLKLIPSIVGYNKEEQLAIYICDESTGIEVRV
jgi:flagellin-like protein